MIVLFFGPPGGGKGTQAARVAAISGLPHVSTGAMLRAEVDKGSALGREVLPIMERGALVPDELMVRIIESRLADPDAAGGVILDGFPRTVPQAQELDRMLERTGRDVNVVLNLDVPPELIRSRILRRAAIEDRADDTLSALDERMRVYERETAPVLSYYRDRGIRVERIDGRPEIDAVTDRILAALGQARPTPDSVS